MLVVETIGRIRREPFIKGKPTIAKTCPFDEIVDAHRYLEGGEQIGKSCGDGLTTRPLPFRPSERIKKFEEPFS